MKSGSVIRARRCYATTGDRIVLDFTMNDLPMGSDLPVALATHGHRAFKMLVAGTHRIDTVEILRNNQVVFSTSPDSDTWEGQWQDEEQLAPLTLTPTFAGDHPFVFYYLRVTQGNRQQAWASPIWLTDC